MKKLALAVIICLSLTQAGCAQPKVAETTETAVPGREISIEDEVHKLVNQYRKGKGLPALQMTNIISDVARKHSLDMAGKKVPFSHDGFDARTRVLRSQIAGMRGAAENVAYGQVTAAEVVADWIKSPGHKANIEGNYTRTGIGVAADKKGVLYYTQIFIR